MNIEIDTINVIVGGDNVSVNGEDNVSLTGEDYWDRDEIARDIQWHLSRALEELSQSGIFMEWEDRDREFDTLELPPVDWEDGIDKTEKLVQLIINALEDTLNG